MITNQSIARTVSSVRLETESRAWAEHAEHIQAIQLCLAEQSERVQLLIGRLQENPREMAAQCRDLQQLQEQLEEQRQWTCRTCRPFAEQLLDDAQSLELFLQAPPIRETNVLELVATVMESVWADRMRERLAARGETSLHAGTGWTVGLLQQALDSTQRSKETHYPIEIVTGKPALERHVQELAQQHRAEQKGHMVQKGILFCTVDPAGPDPLQHVGHVTAIFCESLDGVTRIAVMDSGAELFDPMGANPVEIFGIIAQPVRVIERVFQSMWPEARLFGLDTKMPRQTDRRSCGFFALHDLLKLFQARARGRPLWESLKEAGGTGAPTQMPVWAAKIAQRRWTTLEQICTDEASAAVSANRKEKYSVLFRDKEGIELSINGAAMLKTIKLLQRVLRENLAA